MSSSVFMELFVKKEYLERKEVVALIDGVTPEQINEEWAHFLLPSTPIKLQQDLIECPDIIFVGTHDASWEFGSHCFYSDGETTAEWESGFGDYTLCVAMDDPESFKKAKEFSKNFKRILGEADESLKKRAAQEKEA